MSKNRWLSTRGIVITATLTAIGYGLSWLEFPLFPAAPFLKLDFSTFTTLFGGYMFGFPAAIVIEGLKQLLIWGTKSSTGGVGEIANFIMTVAFVAVPTILYRYKKGKGRVVEGLAIGCVCQIAASMVCNRYITFPLFARDAAKEMFTGLWGYVLAFNAIKSVSVSVLVFFLYKRLSFVLKRYVLTPYKREESALAATDCEPAEEIADGGPNSETVAPQDAETITDNSALNAKTSAEITESEEKSSEKPL